MFGKVVEWVGSDAAGFTSPASKFVWEYGDLEWGPIPAAQFNPNHVPAGSPEGGEFGEGGGGASDVGRVQYDALRNYSLNGHKAINKYLRTGIVTTENVKAQVKAIDAAIAGSTPIASSMTVYRGMRLPADFTPVVGQTFTDNGFVSTSTNRGEALLFASAGGGSMSDLVPVEAQIHIPGGTPYLDIAGYEEEILLGRGATFKITSVVANPQQPAGDDQYTLKYGLKMTLLPRA